MHVLPAGDGSAPRWDSRAALRYRDVAAARRRIAAAHDASALPEPARGRRDPAAAWVRRVVLAPPWSCSRSRWYDAPGVAARSPPPLSPLAAGPAAGAARAVGRGRRDWCWRASCWSSCSGCGSPSGFGLALRTPPFQYLHYQLVGWYLRVLYREAARVLRLRWRSRDPIPTSTWPAAARVLPPRRPGRLVPARPRAGRTGTRGSRASCSATALQWDPALDVVLNRLPNRFIRRQRRRDSSSSASASSRPRSTTTTRS